MKQLKRTFILILILTVIIGARTSAQKKLSLEAMLMVATLERAREAIKDNEYTPTGSETGTFLDNPLLLNGETFDYSKFSPALKGELTVIKKAAKTGAITQVPFYAYLRRNGQKFFIPGEERCKIPQTKMEISDLLKDAKPGDELVIEAANKEDGAVKTILQLGKEGC
jgi:hypothetical protein